MNEELSKIPGDESGSQSSATKNYTTSLAARFHKLLSGMTTAHGSYSDIDWEHSREDGKVSGKAITLRTPITDGLWQRHLEGQYGLGVIPVCNDGLTVNFGAVDIDCYADFDPVNVAAEVARLKLPLVVCRSKSGGAHIYCFSRAPVPAGLMQAKLREVAALLGYGASEVFPKQTQILTEQNDLGSWINCPYHDVTKTNRYAIRPNGEPMTAEEFLECAESLKVDANFFTKSLDNSPPEFKDGPRV